MFGQQLRLQLGYSDPTSECPGLSHDSAVDSGFLLMHVVGCKGDGSNSQIPVTSTEIPAPGI